jgi:hypothetical protein
MMMMAAVLLLLEKMGGGKQKKRTFQPASNRLHFDRVSNNCDISHRLNVGRPRWQRSWRPAAVQLGCDFFD